MTVTDKQTRTIWAITNIFETGSPGGDYSEVAVLPDGAGISYGRSQATDKGGTLDKIVLEYIDRGGPMAAELAPWVIRLADNPPTLQNEPKFIALLKEAGRCPVMRQVQDDVFADGYWSPVLRLGSRLQLTWPLSYAILYDVAIQSGYGRIAKLRQTFSEMPPSKCGDEKSWAIALNVARSDWLGNHSRSIVRKTVYRPEAYRLLSQNNKGWELRLPLVVRGVKVTEDNI